MKNFSQLVAEGLQHIIEIFPWDLAEMLANNSKPLLLDIREADEFKAMHISESILAPRGILESACDYGYSETIPKLAAAREQEIVVICRSGNRSALAALTMQQMAYKNVKSLKTGLRGWNDDEQPLIDIHGNKVDIDHAEQFFSPPVRADQLQP